MAFAVSLFQNKALLGADGILPIPAYMNRLRTHFKLQLVQFFLRVKTYAYDVYALLFSNLQVIEPTLYSTDYFTAGMLLCKLIIPAHLSLSSHGITLYLLILNPRQFESLAGFGITFLQFSYQRAPDICLTRCFHPGRGKREWTVF